jgi:tRNA threonylcarbamoyladenosine biosynthesis protein TsaE
MKLLISAFSLLPQVASEFLRLNDNRKQFAFYGSMGVGKTTFIKELCLQLGVIETVTSPTFAIINEYHTINNQLIYHFDFYRINKIEELLDIGYEDYIFSPHYCFIEWPEKAEELLPEHILKVKLSEMPGGKRMVEF